MKGKIVKKQRKVEGWPFVFSFLAVLFLLVGILSGDCLAEPEAADQPMFFEKDAEPFVYVREGRIDPFVPFVSDKVVRIETQKEELTGMRRFEPGQLTVVAIIFVDGSPVAMVEDSMGLGYSIRPGDEIGRTGIVENILPNQVIVKSYSYTLAGDKRYSTVKMLLKKEGEEK